MRGPAFSTTAEILGAPKNFTMFKIAIHQFFLLSKGGKTTSLKLVSAIFYKMSIFSRNDSPSKTVKNVFYFIEEALFVLEIFKFPTSFLSTVSRFKRTNGNRIIYDVMNWLAWFADVIFRITQKLVYTTLSNLEVIMK